LSQNQGYGFKQTQATGCFLNLAARLARHTGNETYTNYADKSWDWMYNVGFIDDDTWRVYDGSHAELNCTADSLIKTTFSVVISSIAQGSAFMYNQVSTSSSLSRLEKHVIILTSLLPVHRPSPTSGGTAPPT
jgi:mannan endo-1,6-alpha-mannosidase